MYPPGRRSCRKAAGGFLASDRNRSWFPGTARSMASPEPSACSSFHRRPSTSASIPRNSSAWPAWTKSPVKRTAWQAPEVHEERLADVRPERPLAGLAEVEVCQVKPVEAFAGGHEG